MNIFVICRRYLDFETGVDPIGGVHTYLSQLLHLAADQGWSMTLLQQASSEAERTLDEAGRLRVLGFPTSSKHYVRELIARAAALGDPERDILLFATSIQIEKHPFRRSVAVQHGVYWDVPTVHGRRPRFPLDLALRAYQAKKILGQHRLVSRMVCVDYNYVNWLRALTVDRSLAYTVIPNCSDLPAPRSGAEDGKVRLIFARRFEEIRGVDIVMELIPRLLERFPQLVVTLAGGGSREAALKDFFAGNDRVRFVCYAPSESLACHLRQDIAIVPTVGSEGTSLSLLEAMAAGCAVVCSDVGGMSNLILDRFNGRILPPEADAFYEAVSELIENPALRRELAANGRLTVERSFSSTAWEARWRSVLSELENTP